MVNLFQKVFRHPTTITGVLLAASLTVLSACTGPKETTTPQDAKENVTTEELSEGADGLVGQEVSIRSEVEKTVGDASFLLEDKQLFGGKDILVINASGQPFALTEGDDTDVQVTGIVQKMVTADLNKEYGLTLDPSLYADYENNPVVVAKSIALSPDPGEITSDPEKYYNKRIAVKGDVGDKLAPDILTLEEHQLFNNEDLLVITQQDATPKTQEGEKVVVTGVLRPYVKSEFDRDYNLKWDLSVEQQLEAEYTEKPVFVADGVYPSAM
ncbi:MAG: hypothetical protein WBA76_02875 [Phormidesmis sp.]